jgi:hypothetical protein
MARVGMIPKIILLVLLLGGVMGLQVAYDRTKPAPIAGAGGGLPPSMIRMADIGFHPAMASFLWAATMPEILDLFHGRKGYLADLAFLNTVDPKMGYPYAFSVLTLPALPRAVLPDGVAEAQAIGLRGIANGDPDWRIPYYMAINYYLELKDLKDATWYFNVAADTPGVPSYAKRFALNFSINQKERDRVRNLWATVYESSNDPDTKARAAAYVERLNDFDYLEAAAKAYKQKYGSYPSSVDALVARGIIPQVPQDPLGFTFIINSDGTAGIDLINLPAYINAAPAQ